MKMKSNNNNKKNPEMLSMLFRSWEKQMNEKCAFTQFDKLDFLYYLLHVDQQWLSVVLPLHGQLAGVREFITRQLDCHLEAVCVQVAEVVHAWRENHSSIYLMKNHSRPTHFYEDDIEITKTAAQELNYSAGEISGIYQIFR